MPRYNHATIEPKWQAFWEQNKTFAAPKLPKAGGEKLYALDMFPYPSGDGLHVGHPEGYTATDIVCRAARMQGRSVMHPMGFDAFGLPAEEHAIKTGEHPRSRTEKNIQTFRRQLKSLGFSYDWGRELATTDVEYFRWTQWIFLQIYDTWFDSEQQRGRPISELPIPPEVRAAGDDAVRAYQDEHRLAYQSEAPVNWCPALGTVLANEEVIDGKSEVGGHPVVRMPLRQWMLRITAYADRLENDLESLDWSLGIKALQRNWIGRSTGAEVDFYVVHGDQSSVEIDEPSEKPFPKKPDSDAIRIYTTRPDTLYGATYLVVAPEHPCVRKLTTQEYANEVISYCVLAASKSDLDRTELAKDKTGVFTGSYAINPVNLELIPIWIADYVLMNYGTGAIMAVPAHDVRDREFAEKYDLPIVNVVEPADDWLVDHYDLSDCYGVTDEQIVASVRADGTIAPSFSDAILSKWKDENRTDLDPFYCDDCVRLQAKLGSGSDPNVEDLERLRWCYSEHPRCFDDAFTDNGRAINSSSDATGISINGLTTNVAKESIVWSLAHIGLARKAVNYKLRDWLFSRQRFWGEPFPILHELDASGKPTGRVRAVDAKDLPVDLPHLEDFKPHGRPEPPLDKAPEDWLYPVIDGKRYKRETNTMPQWAGSCWYYLRFLDPTNTKAAIDPAIEKAWMPVDLYVGGAEHAVLHLLYARFWHKVLYDRGVVSTVEPFQKLVNQGMILGENNEKMSKSRGNVINPDAIVTEYGADSLRLYEMFMGPLEASKPWSMQGVNGVYGFLNRVWRLVIDERAESMQLAAAVVDRAPTAEENRVLHQTIQVVTRDIAGLAFNTAISRMMEFTNFFTTASQRPRVLLEKFVLLVSPFAPHMAEELWQAMGHRETLAYEPWPEFDPALAKEDTIEVPVQINGKVRSKIIVAAETDKASLEAAARADERIAEQLNGKQIVKAIVVPGRLVNFVVK